jgi:ferric-dicitrate binding protein FerR (iron transport regulator)
VEDIYEHIARDICGERLAPEEERQLARWRQASPEHEKIHEALSRVKRPLQLVRERGGVHVEEARRVVGERTRRVARRRAARRLTCRAAAVLLLAGILFAVSRDPAPPSPTPLYISRGDTRATLLLDDHRGIPLRQESAGIPLAGTPARVSSDGNRIVYERETGRRQARNNTLIVPVGGEYEVVLPDGTVVFLNSGTELRYPDLFTGDRREVHLKGEAWFEVTPDTSRPFIVHAGGIDIRVLGTAFNVSAYEQTATLLTTLLAGSLEVTAGRQQLLVAPGQQALYDKRERQLRVRAVETELYTSWKDGYYTFDQAPLEEIMTTLSLWYGIDVHYRDERLKRIEFTGRLKRYEEASRFLEMLGETRNVLFEMQGNDVTVREKQEKLPFD